MKKQLGDYIQQVNVRNEKLLVTDLRGINMKKEFIKSVANIIGSDMSKYKVVSYEEFAFNPMHVGRDRLLPIGIWLKTEKIIVSPAYTVFEIIDKSALHPEFLMHWIKITDFDRWAWFTTDSSVRGGFSWNSLCDMDIDLPSLEEQVSILLKYIMEKQVDLTNAKKRLLEYIK